MPMLPEVPIIAGETMVSWAARATRFQTGFSLPWLLNATGNTSLKPHATITAQAVQRICDLFGGQCQDIAPAAWIMQPDGVILHQGELFSKSFRRRSTTTFCPLCLIEDGDQRYDRAVWRLSTGDSCVKHRVRLISRASKTDQIDTFLPEQAFPGDADLHELGRSLVPDEPSKLQLYVEKRLAGDRACPTLDALRLDEVTHCTDLLVRALLDEGPASDSHRGAALSDSVRDFAFDALQLGEAGLMTAFGRIMANSAKRHPCNTPRKALGPLYDLVSTRADASALRAPMRAFLLDRLPVAEGYDLFGTPSPPRTKHNLTTLAAASGVTKRILGNALEWFSPLRPQDSLPLHSMVFDAAVAEDIASMLRTSIPLRALEARIGCDPTTSLAINEGGFVEQIYSATGSPGYQLFSADHDPID